MSDLQLHSRAWPKQCGKLVATLLMLALTLTTGCSALRNHTPGDVPTNTQLAISPNGERLLVSWHDFGGKLHAKLFELNGDKVVSSRALALPPNTFTTAFANNNDQLLITTFEKKNNELLKIDLKTNEVKRLYKSAVNLRFPLEVSDENYVFLEGQDPDSITNSWVRFQNSQRALLNPKNYRSAARLGVVGDALFILEPWTPPAFRNIHGDLPKGISALIDKTTFNLVCADAMPLVCLRDHLRSENNGNYYGTMEILNGSRRCDIEGRWTDPREVVISRNGSTVAFQSAIKEHGGERAVYVIKNTANQCAVNTISIKGK